MIDSIWQSFQHGFIRLHIRYVPFRVWRGSDWTFWKEFSLCCGTLPSSCVTVDLDVILYMGLCTGVIRDFRKIIAFWKVSRLCPFVFRVRTTCRRRRMWNIRVILLTGENRSAWGKNLSHFHIANHKSQMGKPGVECGSPQCDAGD
jgi:hypothetical protein